MSGTHTDEPPQRLADGAQQQHLPAALGANHVRSVRHHQLRYTRHARCLQGSECARLPRDAAHLAELGAAPQILYQLAATGSPVPLMRHSATLA